MSRPNAMNEIEFSGVAQQVEIDARARDDACGILAQFSQDLGKLDQSSDALSPFHWSHLGLTPTG
ncbi:hypothetical protein ABIF29_004822 [Bradyrhizobium elkanii]|uniref:Uncharacterized protein n=1 Tax=Bradyrhizobium elkanii TaxID=29448 RepID=A0ABV4F3N1_BRAEL